MHGPRVTVLIAVHDGGAYLQEAVASVLAQTFSDFETLIVDDASTDGAVQKLPSDSRMRVLRNERNLGQVPSLNRGLADARGAYIARIDADDVMHPTRLERQVDLLDREHRVTIVGTWFDVVDERGRRWATSRGRIESYAELVSAILADRIPLAHPSLMYRRDPVLRLGGYDASLAPAEDKDLYRRLTLERHEARIITERLLRYRRHEAQLSQVQMAKQLANDHAGQERFLSSLAPDADPRSLRLLLAGDPAYWSEPAEPGLEEFLDGTTERLRLDPSERREVAATIATLCARTLLRSWNAEPAAREAWIAAPVAFVRAHGDGRLRASLALQPAVHAARPLGLAGTDVRGRTRRALQGERLARPRNLMRRSRLLRRLYTKVVGFRLLND